MSLALFLRAPVPVQLRRSGLGPDALPKVLPERPEEPGNFAFLDTDALVIDAAPRHSYNLSARPSRHPIERGVPATDNVSIDPIVLDIDCVISDTPIEFLSGLREGIGAITNFTDDQSPSQIAFEKLVRLRNEAEPFEVVTGLAIFESMVVTSIRPTRTSRTGGALAFSLRLEQLLIIDTAAPAGAIPRGFRAAEPATPDIEAAGAELALLLIGLAA